MTQLGEEYDVIWKRTGKSPDKFYLDQVEFEQYLDLLLPPDIDNITPPTRNRGKILKEGKGIHFRGAQVTRKTVG